MLKPFIAFRIWKFLQELDFAVWAKSSIFSYLNLRYILREFIWMWWYLPVKPDRGIMLWLKGQMYWPLKVVIAIRILFLHVFWNTSLNGVKLVVEFVSLLANNVQNLLIRHIGTLVSFFQETHKSFSSAAVPLQSTAIPAHKS